MSSSTSPKNFVQGTTGTAMSRGRSGDSILSNNDTKGADSLPGTWSSPSLGAGGGSTGVGIGSNSSSLFGVTGAVAQIARMRTKIDSPLFETEEKDKESQEAEELLASDTELAPPPLPISSASPVSYSRTEDGSKSLSSSMPSSAGTSVATLVNRRPSLTTSQNHSSDQYGFNKGDLGPKPATFEGIKKGNNNSKISSLLAPIMPSSAGHTVVSVSEQSEGGASDEHEMGQELRPIHTPKCNREATEIYPSADEESDNEDKLKNDRTVLPPSIPPPLPPRHVSQGPLQCQPQQHDEIAPDQESVSMRVEPIIQNREDLINRLMNIICGQPESGAHRFRIITIHMAAELLMEFVFTKGVSNNTATNASTIKEENNQAQNAAASQQSAESHLGEVDMQRLASAEAQFRVRVQKGIRRLERKKQRASLKQGGDGAGTASLFPQPLGILTGRIERAMTESKLGIDKQIVNIIAESSVIYGPDKDLDNEPDIDPTPELATLFSLDPEYTNIRHEKTDTRGRTWKNEEYINGQHQNQPPVSSSSNGPISFKERFRSRSRTRSKISSMIRGSSEPRPPQSDRQDAPLQPPQSRLSGTQRLEAMVVRYIKWLHILIQCRQVLSRKAVTPAGPSASPNPATFGVTTNHGLMARALIAGAPLQPTVDTTSVEANSVNLLADKGSPSISITKSFEDSRNSTPLLASIPALNMAPTLPAQIERRSSDLLSGGGHTTPTSSSGNVVSAHKGLQKALATTATTTTTAQGNGTPLTTLESPTLAPKETGGVTGLTPSPLAEPVNADFTWPSSAPSSKSSFTSLSLTSTVPYETADSGSEQGGKPTTTALQSESIKASGRGIGAKSALTATAALEAAAAANSNNANGFGHSINANNHPFINDMLTNHLDPLSASVSEVIRKSSARFKSVVDPLSSNQLFKPSPSPSVASSTLGPEKEPLPPVNKGFYRPTAPIAGPPTELSAATSSASSVVSMNSKPASSYVPTRQRSPSGGSTNSWTSHSAGTAVSTAGTSVLGAVSSSVIRRVSEDYSTLNELTSPGSVKIVRDGNENEDGSGFMSILDPGHPAQQSDPQVAKILETLGLTATNINLSA
ncbi:hypothetical protein BCR41DRAFT_32999 [Lobosporangium transversale]|uniref:Uncharacterized protein n=1 Tax=Lobosporangium transversale TaxID=64571 RepID=A0A1Y2GR42_9FUNG|nr:hypothetical protein BCR41DRAFT_32999 [Lobosporangium transversale]ORZ19977.1 hypothetical protein BCR41DRAFT_32999 [Lobosporangium transversale]|eukprot:XP_021882517.1 hypothetical protein BCR41DRAFT_32999 [Lobosporangium transversale]